MMRKPRLGGADVARLHVLDLLRFVAAFSVLLYHYAFRGYAADGYTVMPYLSLAGIAKYGFMGVNLFFLISGFVVLMTASSNSLRHFVVSRVVRLYPAFWLCCTISYVTLLLWAHSPISLRHYLLNMTMLGDLFGVPSVDSVYWSLFVELKFYLLVSLAMLSGQMRRVHVLLGIWLGVYVVNMIWPLRFVSFFLIPTYAPYFIAGATFYLMYREGRSLYKLSLLVSCFGLAGYQHALLLEGFALKYHAHLSKPLMWLVLVLFFATFWLIASGRTGNFKRPSWLLLGAVTYPLYLIHQNIGYMLFNLGYTKLSPHFLLWGVTASMFAAAYAVYRLEKLVAPPMKAALTRWLMLPERALRPRVSTAELQSPAEIPGSVPSRP
jgi:peptidoglycan/LPS O-acetylase OafA/YrhL